MLQIHQNTTKMPTNSQNYKVIADVAYHYHPQNNQTDNNVLFLDARHLNFKKNSIIDIVTGSIRNFQVPTPGVNGAYGRVNTVVTASSPAIYVAMAALQPVAQAAFDPSSVKWGKGLVLPTTTPTQTAQQRAQQINQLYSQAVAKGIYAGTLAEFTTAFNLNATGLTQAVAAGLPFHTDAVGSIIAGALVPNIQAPDVVPNPTQPIQTPDQPHYENPEITIPEQPAAVETESSFFSTTNIIKGVLAGAALYTVLILAKVVKNPFTGQTVAE